MKTSSEEGTFASDVGEVEDKHSFVVRGCSAAGTVDVAGWGVGCASVVVAMAFLSKRTGTVDVENGILDFDGARAAPGRARIRGFGGAGGAGAGGTEGGGGAGGDGR